MRRILVFITLFMFITGGLSYAMEIKAFPELRNTNLQDAEITGARFYTQESLYGYIDGGAELYLEYGFDSLMITDLNYKGNEIKAEVYKMIDKEAAFGIFSVSHFKCLPQDTLTDYFCASRYQLQFCKGDYYVSIVNSNGTEAEQKFSAHIASVLLGQINEPSFDPASFFPEGLPADVIKSAVFVRGRLGLFNGAYGLCTNLEECNGYDALVIKPEGIPLISVSFNSAESMSKFLEKEKVSPDDLTAGKKEINAADGEIVLKNDKTLILKMRQL